MKTLRLFLFIVAGSLVFVSCGSAGGMVQKGNVSDKASQSLADVLRKNSSIQVTGNGSNAKVLVRGISSINLNTSPLYVVDGVPMGNSYSQANSAINPSQIVNVRVLKSKSISVNLVIYLHLVYLGSLQQATLIRLLK